MITKQQRKREKSMHSPTHTAHTDRGARCVLWHTVQTDTTENKKWDDETIPVVEFDYTF